MRIRRRIVNVDSRGRVLSERVEQVCEDDQGNVEESHASAVWACPACGRPIEKAQDIRGVCTECRRQCCVTCLEHCAVCHCPMCGDCRVGFADKTLSVCPRCLNDLAERLGRQDRLLADKAAFERLMGVYGALMKVSQAGPYESRGSISEIIGEIVRLGLMQKLSRMAKRLDREHGNDQRLLP